jgi:nucleoside-diphosphate-sugar epimerase
MSKGSTVVHLAELSNDPLGELNERTTYEINHLGSVMLASACKEAGVPRFVYIRAAADARIAFEPLERAKSDNRGSGHARAFRAKRGGSNPRRQHV